MKQNENIFKDLKEKIENYRVSLVNLKEHKYNKFYKNKFNEAIKKLNQLKLEILRNRNLIKNKNLKLLKDEIEELLKIKNISDRERRLEEIESNLDNFVTKDNGSNIFIVEKFYDKGEQYDFYSDIKEMLSEAKKRIFIVDSYLDEDLLDIYFKKMPSNVDIDILTNSNTPKGNFPKIARMFARKHKAKFETRESPLCHDRAIFIDEHGWVIGQSIKDLAKNKPSYLRKLDSPERLEKFFKALYVNAKKVI